LLARQESVALPGPIRLLDGWAATAGNPAGAEAAVVRGGNVDRRNLARFSFLIVRESSPEAAGCSIPTLPSRPFPCKDDRTVLCYYKVYDRRLRSRLEFALVLRPFVLLVVPAQFIQIDQNLNDQFS
jgi:hypothetical protein